MLARRSAVLLPRLAPTLCNAAMSSGPTTATPPPDTARGATADLCDVFVPEPVDVVSTRNVQIVEPIFRCVCMWPIPRSTHQHLVAYRDYGGNMRFSGPVSTVKCFENNPLVRKVLCVVTRVSVTMFSRRWSSQATVVCWWSTGAHPCAVHCWATTLQRWHTKTVGMYASSPVCTPHQPITGHHHQRMHPRQRGHWQDAPGRQGACYLPAQVIQARPRAVQRTGQLWRRDVQAWGLGVCGQGRHPGGTGTAQVVTWPGGQATREKSTHIHSDSGCQRRSPFHFASALVRTSRLLHIHLGIHMGAPVVEYPPWPAPKPEVKAAPSGVLKFAKDVVAGTCGPYCISSHASPFDTAHGAPRRTGGIAVTLVGHPFDTLKIRLQTQPADKPIYSMHAQSNTRGCAPRDPQQMA